MFYVRNEDGSFTPLGDNAKIYRTSTTETVIVRREDGSERQEDRECEPYRVEIRPARVVLAWSQSEREAVGVFGTVDQEPPEGMQRAGDPTLVFIDGQLTRVWNWEDAPPAPTRRIFGYTVIARLEEQLGAASAKVLIATVQTNEPVGYSRLVSSPKGVAVDDPRLLASLAKAKEAFPHLDIDAVLAT